MKVCSCCKIEMSLTEFSRNKSKRDGFSSECKPCHRIKRKVYYDANKELEKTRVKKLKSHNILQYKELKASLKCQLCSEKHPATLQFHHLDPSEKEFEVSTAIRLGLSFDRIKLEIDKCAVLCANCHFKEHYQLKEFGTSLLTG